MEVENQMKCIGADNSKVTPDVINQIVTAIGKATVTDGVAVFKPSEETDICKAIPKILEAGAGVVPLARKKDCNKGDVFVDMSDMTSILNIDAVAMTVKVQVGCKIADLEAAVNEKGLTLGAYPGGADATVEDFVYVEDAVIGSYKYGTIKDCIYNVYAVDCNGEAFETGYDNIGYYMSGYNLTQTMVASYGRLGIIDAVTLRLSPLGIIKAVAYTFPDLASMQAAYMKLVQEPSVKPLHISFNATKKCTRIAFQGKEEFVNADIEILDAIMADVGASKAGEFDWSTIVTCDCVNPKLTTFYLPLKNLAAFLDCAVASGTIAGSIPDRSTAAVKIAGEPTKETIDALADKAEELGGRSSSRCFSKYRDESTNAFARRIEQGYMGASVEDVHLDREITDAIIEKIKAIVGEKNVSTTDMDRILYGHDMAPLPKEAGMAFNNMPDVIVRPVTPEQISEVVKLAYKHGIPVIPRGNASWGLGGCMPTAGGILIDMPSKMNKVLEVNTEELYVKVQGGCTWKNLLEACMKKGYIIGSYPSSFPAGTVGAWIATNGMGVGSIKYGSAKDNVLNSVFIVDDGSIVTTGFDNMGSYRASYNLNQFFSGAEGTLGVMATVTFRIYPMGKIRPLAYEFDTLKAMNEPIQDTLADPSVKPLHIAWSDHLHFEGQRKAGWHAPDVTNLWLVTLQGDDKHNELEEAFFDAVADKYGGRKVAYEIAEHEWEERCYEFRARHIGVGEIPAEVIVPAHDWGEFTDRCYEGFEEMKMEAGGIIGVMVDRSTTLFMPYYFKDDEMLTGMLSFGFNFYLGDIAAKYGGRSTGLGVFFAWNLDNIHSAATVGKMRELKTVLDPHDVVNPGHVVCGSTRFGINLTKGLMGLGSSLMQVMKKIMPNDRAFKYNKERFRYNDLEEMKTLDRVHTLGDGTQ